MPISTPSLVLLRLVNASLGRIPAFSGWFRRLLVRHLVRDGARGARLVPSSTFFDREELDREG